MSPADDVPHRPDPALTGGVVRPWDRLRIPGPPADPSVLTGRPVRRPVRRDVAVADPVSGAGGTVAVWSCPATAPADPQVPDVVLVHGFRGDRHGLALVADCLPEHAVHAVELPGFGASPAFPDAEHTVAHHAEALRAAVAGLDLSAPPVVLAHSYGTVVASHAVAAGMPAVALVLLNPIAEPALDASGSLGARALAVVARAYYAAAARLPERAARAVLGAPPVVWATTVAMSETGDRAVLGFTHDQHRRHFSSFASAGMLAEAYRASSSGTVLQAAAGLRLPVLLVAGVQDPMGSPAAQRALAEAVRAAGGTVELHLLEGVGHLLHYERPVRCAALVRTWLAGLARAA